MHPHPQVHPTPAAPAAATRTRQRRRPRTGVVPGEGFLELRLGTLWSFLKSQPAAFWFINAYMLFEYVRPQSIYRSIDVLPWTLGSILMCAVFFLLQGGKWHFFDNAADFLMIAFSGLVLVSGVTAYEPQATFNYNALSIWFTWLVVYFLITNTVTTEKRFFIFMVGFLLYSLKMSQHGFRSFIQVGGSFRSWGATGAPGWFRNSGEFGIQMTIFFPLSVYFIAALRPYVSQMKLAALMILPVTAAISIVATSSRGAVVGGALVLLWMVARSRYKMRALPAAAVVGLLVFALIPPQSRERFSSMGEDEDSVRRLTYWTQGMEIMRDHPVLGVGYNNWLPYYRDHYLASNQTMSVSGGGGNLFRYAQVSHNPFIQAGAELGYPGVLLFVVLIGSTFVINAKTRRLARRMGDQGRFARHMALGLDGALVGFLGSGFFVTVLYYPYFWINLAMTVALLRSTRRRLREVGTQARRPPPGGSRQPARGRGGQAGVAPLNAPEPRTAPA